MSAKGEEPLSQELQQSSTELEAAILVQAHTRGLISRRAWNTRAELEALHAEEHIIKEIDADHMQESMGGAHARPSPSDR